MNISELFATAQLARIDQVDDIVAKHSDPESRVINGAYEAIEFPLGVTMERLDRIADRARKLRDVARAFERIWQSEAEDVRLALEPLVAWFVTLHLAIGQALAAKDPVARKLAHAAFYGEAKPDDYRDGRGNLGAVIEGLARYDLSVLKLPADFLDQGRRIDATLAKERREASRALVRFHEVVLLLRQELDRIPPIVEELAAAWKRACHETGVHLPGLDLMFVRAAAADSGPRMRAADEAPEGDTGL